MNRFISGSRVRSRAGCLTERVGEDKSLGMEATTMAGRATCPDCGGELTGPRGHCPLCLLKAGLEGESLSVGVGGAVGVTMALGSPGSLSGTGVLAALASSVGPVPRVLLRDTDGTRRYQTIDRWHTMLDFQQFKNMFQSEYKAIDEKCEELTESERLVGIFEEM